MSRGLPARYAGGVKAPDSNRARNTVTDAVAAIAAAVPGVGVIAGVVQAGLAAAQRERDEVFFAYLAASGKMTQARVEAIANGEDPEFLANAHRIIREAQTTVDEDKRRLLASVLGASGSWSPLPQDEREELLPFILELTMTQARVLEYLADPRAAFDRTQAGSGNGTRAVGVSTRGALMKRVLAGGDSRVCDRLVAAAHRLDAKGLTQSNLSQMMSPGGVLGSGTTTLGDRVLRYLRDALPDVTL